MATTPKTTKNPTPKQLAKKEEAARRKADKEKEREEAKAEKERQRLEEKLAKDRKREEERARKEAEKVEKERLREEDRARKETEKVEKERLKEEEKNKKEEVSGANMCHVALQYKLSTANLLEGFGASAVFFPQLSIMHIVDFNLMRSNQPGYRR